PAEGLISSLLFEWVIENLCRNAANAIGGNEGKIIIRVSQNKNHVVVDVKDTGVGIPRSKHEAVFQPGYTTRKRGWGLGLSLTRDRKSTRLNSSHVKISYAVFCLKK